MPAAIVKYFYEEPVALEVLVPDADAAARPRATLESLLFPPARYYRGYLAGRDAAEQVGLTAVASESWLPGLEATLGPDHWHVLTGAGTLEPTFLAAALSDLSATSGLFQSTGALDVQQTIAAAHPDRRRALPFLRVLLDAGVTVLLPEKAAAAFDLTLFAPFPVQASLLAAWRARSAPGVRRFVAPYQRMRAEHRFYFETWQLDTLPDYVEEA